MLHTGCRLEAVLSGLAVIGRTDFVSASTTVDLADSTAAAYQIG